MNVLATTSPPQGGTFLNNIAPWLVPLFAIVFSFVTFSIIRYGLRERIQKRMIDDTFRSFFENIDVILMVIAAVLTTSWKLYDIRQWTDSAEYLIATTITSIIITSAIYAKIIKSRFSFYEKKSIQAFENEINVTRQARNWLINTGQMIDEMVQEKYNRLHDLLPKNGLVTQDIISREHSQRQIVTIVHTIHEFFSELLNHGSTLRLGIYFRSAKDPDSLDLGFSWNGEAENCFSAESAKYLKIVRSGSVMSELAKCYNSDEGIIIQSDCAAAERRGEFMYLNAEQRSRIASLIVYRFNVTTRPKDSPWIIYLDSNQPGFFDVTKKPDYQLFFERVSKRLAFELVTIELCAKLPPQV